MFYTIINNKGKILELKSFRDLINEPETSLVWLDYDDCFESNNKKLQPCCLKIKSCHNKIEFNDIDKERLIILEERLESINFKVIPDFRYRCNLQFRKEKILVCAENMYSNDLSLIVDSIPIEIEKE